MIHKLEVLVCDNCSAIYAMGRLLTDSSRLIRKPKGFKREARSLDEIEAKHHFCCDKCRIEYAEKVLAKYGWKVKEEE